MKSKWKDEERYKLLRAGEIYDRQWVLIYELEFPHLTLNAVQQCAHKSGDWRPPKGTKKLELKIEKEPKAVYEHISRKLEDPVSRCAIPKCLHKYQVEPLPKTPRFDFKAELLKKLKQKSWSVVELSNHFDVSPQKIEDALQALGEQSYLVKRDEKGISLGDLDPTPDTYTIDTREYKGDWISFGAVSDTHLGSKWERLDVLNALYDIFEQEKITTVYHAGNIVEGDSRFNKFDVKVTGVEQQISYCLEHYPKKKGITTHYITGDDHEGWWIQREGIDFGRRLEQTAKEKGRDDLVYLGHVEADIRMKAQKGESVMRIMHPGGGSAYALSYAPQKIVEAYQGGEKPHILLLGHLHKFDYCFPREVHVIQVGCTQDQSIFMRKKKLQALIGGCIIRLKQAPSGEILRFQVEWFPFFDRGFYERKYDVT